MKIARHLMLPLVFVTFAAIALATATFAVRAIERTTAQDVRSALTLDGQDWAEVTADGLLVRLTGTAANEAARSRALLAAGRVVDAARLIDDLEVRPAAGLTAPEFTVEVLRNDDGISLIGLIPATDDRDAVVARVAGLAGEGHVSDMLETADYPAPPGWRAALDFGLASLAELPRSKISITPRRVTVTAITASAEEKARLEAEIARRAPEGLDLVLGLSAPRPVITPFTLHFLIDGEGARFDACSADTEAVRTSILAAAVAAGAPGDSECIIGLGVPSPRWGQAAEAAIAALAELGAGSLTFSDADVSLIAAETVGQEDFDRVAGELDRALPDAFSLTSVLTPKADTTDRGPPQFQATLGAGGLRMQGRLTDEKVRTVVESFATARFGAGRIYNAVRLDADLPEGWPVRVLAGLEALDVLSTGDVLVRPDLVRISGQTGRRGANAEIARLLAAKLGGGQKFEIDVAYVESLDPVAALPTPEDCVRRVNMILAERKITFAPGSAEIAGDALETLDLIADALRDCAEVKLEIAAHSDSQGRDEMNLALSQRRADAVLNGLIGRRVLTSNLTAKGYGKAHPIADNSTEEGREANRRIEFSLLLPEEDPAAGDTAGDGQAAEDAAGEGGAAADGNEQD